MTMAMNTRTYRDPPTPEELKRRSEVFARILALRSQLPYTGDLTALIREGRDAGYDDQDWNGEDTSPAQA